MGTDKECLQMEPDFQARRSTDRKTRSSCLWHAVYEPDRRYQLGRVSPNMSICIIGVPLIEKQLLCSLCPAVQRWFVAQFGSSHR